jgi:hypothetical protein
VPQKKSKSQKPKEEEEEAPVSRFSGCPPDTRRYRFQLKKKFEV